MRVAIIGGGLAGLTVAFRRARAGDRVTLYEASERLGGQLWSERVDGFVVEHGAEGFVARSEAVQQLASDLGIADRLVEQLTHRSFRFDGSGLRELAPGEAARLLGFQVASDELGRGIRSFQSGMSDLPDGLANALSGEPAERVELRPACPVLGVELAAGAATLTLASGASASHDAVVIATGAVAAGRLLASAVGAPAVALYGASSTSSVTVTLAYSRAAIGHALDGTGFISDPALLGGARAATFVSSKLPGRAPADQALLRVFFRPTDEALADTSSAWAKRAHDALCIALSIAEPPGRSWVSRWGHALPLIDEAQRARVGELETALAGTGIRLSGSAFHGSGIDAAVRSAELASRALG